MSKEKVLKLRLEKYIFPWWGSGKRASWLKPEVFCLAGDRAEHRKKLLRREGPDQDVPRNSRKVYILSDDRGHLRKFE